MSDSLSKWAQRGTRCFLGMLQNIGVPAAGFMVWFVGAVEVVGRGACWPCS